MFPKALILAAALAAGSPVAAVPALAQDAPAPASPAPNADPAAPKLPIRVQVIFNLIDVNGDGFIDQTEIAALQRALFSAVDADNDSKLSEAEFARITPGQRAGRFARFMHRHGPRGGEMGPGFHRGQRDGRDGGPRGDRGRHSELAPQGLGQGGPGPEGLTPQMGDNAGLEELLVPGQAFAVLDLNSDGSISIEEFPLPGPRQAD